MLTSKVHGVKYFRPLMTPTTAHWRGNDADARPPTDVGTDDQKRKERYRYTGSVITELAERSFARVDDQKRKERYRYTGSITTELAERSFARVQRQCYVPSESCPTCTTLDVEVQATQF